MPRALRWLRNGLYLLFLSLLLALAGLAGTWILVNQPAAVEAPDQVIQVKRGAGLGRIAAQLHEAGVIRHPLPFVLFAKLKGMAPRLQAGEYVLSAAMTPADILDALYLGKVRHLVLTVPEGATLRDIAVLAEAGGLGSRGSVMALTSDPAFIASLGLDVPTLEGYLFPDTYHLTRDMGAADLLAVMAATLARNYPADIADRAAELGMSKHAVLTLASLIEKEAQLDAERGLISAVFHNRLRRGMRLQCDSTVIYALGEDFTGDLRKADLRVDSPYNTYRYGGLPPGPIASPGERSIAAAVSPADVKYLYFVATRQGGAHHFSTTLREHNRAVRKYQLNR